MLLRSSGGDRYILEASKDELLTLSNALNEVCNGIHIDDAEFSTRLGATRAEVRRLLRSVHGALEGIGPAPA